MTSSTSKMLDDYKRGNLNINDLTYYEAFNSVFYFNKNATNEEVVTIVDCAYDAWKKDNEGYSISKFTNFLSEHYFNRLLA